MIDFMIILGIILIILLIVIISRKCKKKEGFETGKLEDLELNRIISDCYIQVIGSDGQPIYLNEEDDPHYHNKINNMMFIFKNGPIDFNIIQPDNQEVLRDDHDDKTFERIRKMSGGNNISNGCNNDVDSGFLFKDENDIRRRCIENPECEGYTTYWKGKNIKAVTAGGYLEAPWCMKKHIGFDRNSRDDHNLYVKQKDKIDKMIKTHIDPQHDNVNSSVKYYFKYTHKPENITFVPGSESGNIYTINDTNTAKFQFKFIGDDKYIIGIWTNWVAKKLNQNGYLTLKPYKIGDQIIDCFQPSISGKDAGYKLKITKINPEIIKSIINKTDNKLSSVDSDLDLDKLKIIEFDTASVSPYDGNSIFEMENTYIYKLTIGTNEHIICFIKEGTTEDKYAIIKLDGGEDQELQYLHKTKTKTETKFKPFVFGNDLTTITGNTFTLKYNDFLTYKKKIKAPGNLKQINNDIDNEHKFLIQIKIKIKNEDGDNVKPFGDAIDEKYYQITKKENHNFEGDNITCYEINDDTEHQICFLNSGEILRITGDLLEYLEGDTNTNTNTNTNTYTFKPFVNYNITPTKKTYEQFKILYVNGKETRPPPTEIPTVEELPKNNYNELYKKLEDKDGYEIKVVTGDESLQTDSCFVKAPSGCYKEKNTYWDNDWTQSNYKGINVDDCFDQTKGMNKYCHTNEIEMKMFIDDTDEKIKTPGCYVRAPSGCYKDKNTYWDNDWTLSNYKETNSDDCFDQTKEMNDDCHVNDIETHFVHTYESLYTRIQTDITNNLFKDIYIKFFWKYDGKQQLYIKNFLKNPRKNDYKNRPYFVLENNSTLDIFKFDKIATNKNDHIIYEGIKHSHRKGDEYFIYSINTTNNTYELLFDTSIKINDININTDDYKILELATKEYKILKQIPEFTENLEGNDIIIKNTENNTLYDSKYDTFKKCVSNSPTNFIKIAKNNDNDCKYIVDTKDNKIMGVKTYLYGYKKGDNLILKLFTLNKYKPTVLPYEVILTDSIHKLDSCENIKYDKVVDPGDTFMDTKMDTEIDRNILYTIKNDKNQYLNVIKNTDGSISSKYIEESKDKKITLLDRKTKYVGGKFISSSTPYFYFDDTKLVFFLSDKQNLPNKREINIHKYYNKLDPFFKDKILDLTNPAPITDYKNIINTPVETEIVLIDNDNIKREGTGFKFSKVNKNIKGFNRSTTYTFEPVTTEVIPHELAKYKAEQTRVQSIHDKLEEDETRLKTNIKDINKKVNETIENINSKIIKIDTLLNKYKVHSSKNINQKLKDILIIIYKNYQIELDIILLRQSYQAKVQFSVNISTDEEYIQILKNEIDNAKFEIKRLELQIKEKNLKNYVNLQETNQIIQKVNSMINIIQKKLDSLNKKENFDGHIKYNAEFDNHYDDITKNMKIINTYIINNNTLYDNKVKLEENLTNLETYNTLLENKTKNLEKNYIDMFNKFDQGLYDLKNKLYSKSDNKENRLKLLKRKFNIDNLQLANIKFNHIEKDALELELMNLQDQINSLNVNIKGVNLINRAGNQLKELKKINLHIIKYRLMNTRAYEGFQNGSIDTVKDIINRNDFGLSKPNEDNLNDFRTSQSLYNNENISIQPIQEDNTFKIHINNKCLEVRGDKNYSLKECDKVTPTQYFEAIKIKNKAEAIETNKVIPSNEKIKYPFYQMVSSISGNCLSLDDHGVSVIPCNTNSIQQHWKMKKHEKLCLDN